MERKIRRQPAWDGGRDPLAALVIGPIRQKVLDEAARFHVSTSWVVSVRLGASYKVEEQPHWNDPMPKKSRKSRNRRTRT